MWGEQGARSLEQGVGNLLTTDGRNGSLLCALSYFWLKAVFHAEEVVGVGAEDFEIRVEESCGGVPSIVSFWPSVDDSHERRFRRLVLPPFSILRIGRGRKGNRGDERPDSAP
jgi:hypothetical protein